MSDLIPLRRRTRTALDTRPVGVIAIYTIAAILPVYLTGAYGIRIQSDLDFGTTEFGFALSGFFVGGSIAAVTMGPVVDRIGAPTSLRLGVGLSAVSSLGMALLVNSWWTVGAAMSAYGVANAVTHLALNRILVSRASLDRQATGFGIKQAAVPAASLIAGFTVILLGTGFPWSASFAIAAAVAAIAALAVPEVPRRQIGMAKSGARRRGLLRLATASGAAGAAGNSISLLLVDSLDANGFSEAYAAAILAAGSGLAIISRLTAGRVVDRRKSDGHFELKTLFAVGFIGFLILAIADSSPILLIVGALIAFVGSWGWQGLHYFIATLDRSIAPATSSAMAMAGVMVGSILGPMLIALVADNYGYSIGWAAASGMLLVGLLSAAGMPRPQRT